MVFPRRGDDHPVQAALLDQPLPGVDVALLAVRLGRRFASLGHHVHAALEHDRFDIAQRDHLHVIAADQLLEQHLAAHAGADQAQPHLARACPGGRVGQQAGGGDGRAGGDEFSAFHGQTSCEDRAGRDRRGGSIRTCSRR